MSEAQTTELNGWSRLSDMPVGKWEPATIARDGRFYVFGGYEDNIASSKRTDIYDPADDSWTRMQDLPSAISHVNLVNDDGGIWFAGGMKDKRQPAKDFIIDEVWQYCLEQDRYIAAPLLPGRRAGGGLARIGNRLHYISGLKQDRDSDASEHWVLDLDTWEQEGGEGWQRLAPFPLPRNQFSTAVLNDEIYCIGGQFNHDSQQLDQPNVDIYDPMSDTWRAGPPLSYGHSHSEGATFVYGDTIFMVGGHSTPPGGKKGFSDDVLALPAGGEWQTVCKLPRATSSPAATIIDDNLYFAGGWNGGMNENKVWLMSSEVWVRPGISAALSA
ncbi:MAG: hypothetical protein O2780_14105 [Proteobacteria bacterium]|jgi:N-acetylneuraminic acid mutarotase|nr:hypothetical protein [Pseudomonadota bacterium]MDA1300479.1 hypothetical protein [Pseudomonadota bacterium]